MRNIIAIKEGQLRKFKGATVRVVKPTNNDMWLVTGKGQLWGFAKDSQLDRVSNREKRTYEGKPSLVDRFLGASEALGAKVGLLSVALIVTLTIVLS
jgi:hypothetical protein|tara:strand:+ start:5011 stop:5301 length:291 start_codon:yes stop_codon:yes gene_type:complete